MRYKPGEIDGEAGKRIEVLDRKWQSEGLGVEETREFMGLMKEHAGARVFEFPDLASLGVTDHEQFFEHVHALEDEAETAYRNRYFLEAISLRMLLLDFFLRAYVVSRTSKPIEPYSKQDMRTFKPLVDAARGLGLPARLAKRLLAFNEKRNGGIHRYLLGRGDSYEEIGDAYREANGLDFEIMEAIANSEDG